MRKYRHISNFMALDKMTIGTSLATAYGGTKAAKGLSDVLLPTPRTMEEYERRKALVGTAGLAGGIGGSIGGAYLAANPAYRRKVGGIFRAIRR